jgi:chromosome segregation ATPase
MDRKFSFSRSEKSLGNAILASAEEIELLKAHVREGTSKLPARDAKLLPGGASLESIRQRLAIDGQRLATLTETRETLRRVIPTTTEEFANYRAKYRAHARTRAAGESLEKLTVRGGREYHQVVISQVTDVGLEIRHADGIARIQAPDLDQTLQDRFQWNEEERRARLIEEHAANEAPSAPSDSGKLEEGRPEEAENGTNRKVPGSGNRKPPSWERPLGATKNETTSPDAARIEALRGKVIGWKSKVSKISTELSQARSSSYGSQSSVPGSLETWQAKSNRLASELARAKAGLAAAKASLASVSPNDSLLRPDPSGD